MAIIDPFMEQRRAAPTIVDPFAAPKPTGIVDPFAPTFKPSEPAPEDQSVFRQFVDVPLGAQKSLVSGLRIVADTFGASSSTSKNLREVEEHLAGLMSAQSKKDSAEIARIMKDAEDKGIGAQIGAGLKALSIAPVDIVVNALGTSAPVLIAGLAGGLPGVAVMGAMMGAGTVKGAIYETVKEELIKAKYDPADAEARAAKAQEYFGDNTGMIATGAGLGVLESITGAQPALLRLMGRKIAVEAAEDIAKKTMGGAIVKGAFKEATPEFLQGAQEQMSRNIALQNEGFDVPTMRGVVSQGTLEAGAGAMIGGITSPIDLAVQQQKVSQLQNRIDALQNTAPPPGSDEERVLQRAAEIEARGNVDRQSAMIMAMNEVATENRLSEKIDGPKLPEQTGQAPLFIFNTPESAQERVNLLRRNRPKDNFAIYPTPDGKFAIHQIPVESRGAADVTAPISEAGGVGPAIPSPAGMGGALPGAGVPIGDRLDGAGVAAGTPDVGAGAQLAALRERAADIYDDLIAAGYTPEQSKSVAMQIAMAEMEYDTLAEQGALSEAAATTPTTAVPSATPSEAVGEAAPAISPAVAAALETPPSVTPTKELEQPATTTPAAKGTQQFTMSFKDGSTDTVTYSGELANNLPNGQGTVTFSDGSTLTGTFKDGEIINVTETTEAKQAEEKRPEEAAAATAEPIAEEVLSESELETKAAIDAVNTATEELNTATDEREAAAKERGAGQAEPAKFRRMSRDASKKLATAISGKSGLINVIKKLQIELAQARAALEPYGGETFNEDLLRQRGLTIGNIMDIAAERRVVTEEEKAAAYEQDVADMEAAYSYFYNTRKTYQDALVSLAEFNVNPRFAQDARQQEAINKAQAATLEFIKTLPYEDKLQAFQTLSEREAAPEAAPAPAAKPAAAPTVTVKKKRRVEIPPRSQARVPKRIAPSLVPNPALEQFSGKPITDVLTYISSTGNPFERALATRLLARDNRAGIRPTTFYVINPDQLASAPDEMQDANGLYDLDGKTDNIYVRGSGFGPDPGNMGINNQIVLHEAVHATVNKRLIYAMYAEELGLSVPDNLKSVTQDLIDLMERSGDVARQIIREYQREGEEIPADLVDLIEGDAFSKVTEFVAYGMTDPYMQKFLRENVTGVVTRTNGFTEFVRSVLTMLGLGPEHTSGLRDLIEFTDRLAATVNTDAATARAILDTTERNKVRDIPTVSRAAKKAEDKSTTIQAKIETSATADEVVEELGSLANVAKNPKLWGQYLSMNLSNINFSGLNALLAMLPTHMVVELGSNKGITHLNEVDTNVREMSTMRTKMQARVQEIATPWIKLSAPVQKQLSKVMSYATLAQVDPAKEKGVDKTLDDMYKALPQDAKDVYVAARDFYADTYALYRALLEQGVTRMGGDPETLGAIRAMYEVAQNKGPYFPLMRYGQFWVRIGKGDKKEFYMFESAGLRDVFIKRRMEELASKGEKRTFDEMVETDDADLGNDVNALRENMVKDSLKLQNMFKLIDRSSTLGDEKARAALKDQVYQMYLLTLPEASMRKHFIHRKDGGVTGFSGDALRNFLNSGTRMSNQLARVRYGADINNAIDMAREALKGNPEKDKLEAIVKEVELRTSDELNPPVDDTFLEKTARGANKIAFLWLLTSAKSAANQMFSIINFTLPTLGTRYGWGKAMAEMSKYMALGYGQMGVVKKLPNGTTTWVAPTIGLSDRVAKNPEEQRAYQRMQDMGISDMTRTYDLFLRRGAPSINYNSRWAAVTNMMGALFHHSERISREITFMSSFRLAKDAGQTFEQAIDSATRDVNTALFDYSAWNRPRALRAAPVRVVTQFKQFPMYVTLYLVRNGYQLIKAGATPQERKEAASMLFGTLGFTALIAGTAGLPTYSVIMGVIQGIRNALRDDDEEDPLPEMDTEMWFRNIFLPEFFGDNKIMGMKLSELVDSGILNTATGYDVASGVSLNNMWFHDTPDANNWKGAFDSTMVSMMGPGASVIRNMFASIDDFNNGQYIKGTEKLLPAFFRGSATATRFATEGALATTGAEIKAAEDFTNAQLVAQMLGYKTTGLAQIMNNNYVIQQKINGLKNERANLLKRLDIAFESGNDSDVESILDDIDNFSGKYPTYRIKPSEISSSMKSREKIRRKSEAGLYLDKRARDFAELRDRALSNLEAETEK